MIKKKGLICILICIFVLSIMYGNVFAEKTLVDKSHDYEIEMMKSLELISEENGDKALSKVDFIQIISKMLNYKNGPEHSAVSVEAKTFNDVDNYHYAIGDIEFLAGLGIISGDGNGILGVNDLLTAEQAYTMMLNAAGYKEMASYKGEYPYNYINIAVSLGLSDGINEENPVTLKTASKMIYNLMNIQVMEYSTGSGTGTYYEGDEFYKAVMGLGYCEGVIETVGEVSITEQKFVGGEVLLNGEVFDNRYENAKLYVGYNVGCYYRDGDDREIVYIYPDQNEVIMLNNEDIVKYENRTYMYFDENGKKKTIDIAGDLYAIYNNYPISDISELVPEYGTVKIIDNNRDGKYEVVFVNDYEVAWVEDTLSKGNSIILSNPIDDGKKIISLDDFEKYSILDSDGISRNYESLSNGGLVSVQRCGRKEIVITMHTNIIRGRVDEIREEEEKETLIIDGKKYNILPNAYKHNWRNEVGGTIEAHLDNLGSVGAIFASGADMDIWQYGFIVKGKVYNNEMDDNVNINLKVLAETGTMCNYIITDKKLKIDGEMQKLEDAALLFEQNCVIRYQVEGEKIKAIDFPYSLAMTSDEEILVKESDSLLMRVKGDLKAVPKKNTLKKASATIGDLDGEILCRNAAIPVFSVPPLEEISQASDNAFSVTTVSNLVSNTIYKIEGYNSNPKSLFMDVAVIYGSSSANYGGKIPIMVNKILTCLNDEDEVVDAIEGYMQGELVQYNASSTLDKNMKKDLNTGDLVQVLTDYTGAISDYRVLYSKTGNGVISDTNPSINKYDSGTYEHIVLGYAAKIEDGIIQINHMDDDYAEFFELNAYEAILIYDSTEAKNKVRVASVQDIVTKKHSDKCDRIIIMHSYSDQKCLWIVR